MVLRREWKQIALVILMAYFFSNILLSGSARKVFGVLGILFILSALFILTHGSSLQQVYRKPSRSYRIFLLFLTAMMFSSPFFNTTELAYSIGWLYYGNVCWTIYWVIPIMTFTLIPILIARKYSNKKFHQYNWDLYLFAIWALLISPFGSEPVRSGIYALWILLSFIILTELINSLDMEGNATKSLLFVFLLITIPFIALSLTQGPLAVKTGFEGVFHGRVSMGMCCGITFSLSLALLVLGGIAKYTRALLILLILITLIIAPFTLNRACWLGIIVCLLFYLLTEVKKQGFFKMVFGILFIGIVLSILFYTISFPTDAFQTITDRIEYTELQLSDPNQQISRVPLWKAAIEFSRQRPFTGTGLARAGDVYGSVGREYLFLVGCGMHNIFIGYLVQTGIVGLVLFIFILIKTLLSLTKANCNLEKKQAILLLFIGSMTNSLFDSQTCLPISPLFWSTWTSIILMRSFRIKAVI